jgi:hypothetical protein
MPPNKSTLYLESCNCCVKGGLCRRVVLQTSISSVAQRSRAPEAANFRWVEDAIKMSAAAFTSTMTSTPRAVCTGYCRARAAVVGTDHFASS